MNDGKSEIEYSIVVPVYNEELILNEFYRRLAAVMARLKGDWEVIFVDDGSHDSSLEIIKSLNNKDPRVKAVCFSRNFGHHIAVTAGMDHSRGNAVILMDGDLQDPPEEIIRLNDKLKEGYDIVCAVNKTRKDPLFKKIAGKLFYFVFAAIGMVKISGNSGIYRIISRRALDAALRCRESSRFVVGLIDWVGFKTATIVIDRDRRYAGQAKYNFAKSLKLAMNAIFSFSYFPLRLASYLGLLMILAGLAYGIYIAAGVIILNVVLSGYAPVIAFVAFVTGIQLIAIGILGEYLGRIYDEVKARPLYIIGETVGME